MRPEEGTEAEVDNGGPGTGLLSSGLAWLAHSLAMTQNTRAQNPSKNALTPGPIVPETQLASSSKFGGTRTNDLSLICT